MSVTDPDSVPWSAESRNAALEAELVAEVEAAISSPRRALLASVFGEVTDDDLAAQTTLRFLRQSAYRCDLCGHVFTDGEIVYRRWHGGQFDGGRTLGAFCEGCARRKWHESWWRIRREPVPCAGTCGVRVTHPYLQSITTCSSRCARRALADRRRVDRDARECAECGKAFDPGRVDARFCSNACRQRAYRKRGGG